MDRPLDTSIAELSSREYEVTWFQAGDFKDQHNNWWCNAAFAGVSEPATWVVKDPTTVKVGDKVYGKFTLETARTGRQYLRFRREQRPEQSETPATPGASQQALPVKKEWQPRDDNAIRAQWAIGQARDLFVASVVNDKTANMNLGNLTNWNDGIEAAAKIFYAMVDRIKGDDSPKAEAPAVGLTPEEQQAQDQAKRDAERLRNTFNDGSPVPDVVHDFSESEPVSLDEIPF